VVDAAGDGDSPCLEGEERRGGDEDHEDDPEGSEAIAARSLVGDWVSCPVMLAALLSPVIDLGLHSRITVGIGSTGCLWPPSLIKSSNNILESVGQFKRILLKSDWLCGRSRDQRDETCNSRETTLIFPRAWLLLNGMCFRQPSMRRPELSS
jgi:hypothetical protein